MWKNILEPGRPLMTIEHMRIACWIPKTKSTLSEYVVLIAFPPQEQLHGHTSLLPSQYTACLLVSREGPYSVHLCN